MKGLHVLLLVVFVTTVGCGGADGPADVSTDAGSGSTDSATSFDDVDVCALMTREQAGEMLGVEVGEGEKFGLVGCEWAAPSGPTIRLQVFGETGAPWQE